LVAGRKAAIVITRSPPLSGWRPAPHNRTKLSAQSKPMWDTVLYHSRAACPDAPQPTRPEATLLAKHHRCQPKYTIEPAHHHPRNGHARVQHHEPVTDTPSTTPQELPQCFITARKNSHQRANARNGRAGIARQLLPSQAQLLGAVKITTPRLGSRRRNGRKTLPRPSHSIRPALASFPDSPHSITNDPVRLSAELAWDELVGGDPLRFHLRLQVDRFSHRPWLNGTFCVVHCARRRSRSSGSRLLAALPHSNAFETSILAPNVTLISSGSRPPTGVTHPGPYRSRSPGMVKLAPDPVSHRRGSSRRPNLYDVTPPPTRHSSRPSTPPRVGTSCRRSRGAVASSARPNA